MQEAAASDLMQGEFSCNSQGKKNGFHDSLEQEKGRAQHDQRTLRNLLYKMPKGQNFPINWICMSATKKKNESDTLTDGQNKN